MRVVYFMRCNDYILFLYLGDGVSAGNESEHECGQIFTRASQCMCAFKGGVVGMLCIWGTLGNIYITTLKHAG